MLPLIHARFRRRNGVPYAVEQLSGRQFRCRHCNQIFFKERELDRHIDSLARASKRRSTRILAACPKLSSVCTQNILYTYDFKDHLQRPWLKLKKGESYDGI